MARKDLEIPIVSGNTVLQQVVGRKNAVGERVLRRALWHPRALPLAQLCSQMSQRQKRDPLLRASYAMAKFV